MFPNVYTSHTLAYPKQYIKWEMNRVTLLFYTESQWGVNVFYIKACRMSHLKFHSGLATLV